MGVGTPHLLLHHQGGRVTHWDAELCVCHTHTHTPGSWASFPLAWGGQWVCREESRSPHAFRGSSGTLKDGAHEELGGRAFEA